jgi:hypothetical protein
MIKNKQGETKGYLIRIQHNRIPARDTISSNLLSIDQIVWISDLFLAG